MVAVAMNAMCVVCSSRTLKDIDEGTNFGATNTFLTYGRFSVTPTDSLY